MHSYYSFSSPTPLLTQEKLTEEEIVALLQEADADKNGKIKFDHFLQVMLAK
jgi:Ca2+-binding EF-hand superfamily protein